MHKIALLAVLLGCVVLSQSNLLKQFFKKLSKQKKILLEIKKVCLLILLSSQEHVQLQRDLVFVCKVAALIWTVLVIRNA